MQKVTYEFLVENDLILYECIVGSQAYGTNIETSDVDYKFVYILPMDYILGTEYKQQIDLTKDITGWEIKRFLELIESNNPTVLELLNSPEHCIVKKHPLFDIVINHKQDFITKTCKNSFGGYARQQIKKAKGLNKKQNWEKNKVTRKDLLDFCYVLEAEKSIPWKEWNIEKYDEKFIGVSNVPNARDVYTLFYDTRAYMMHSLNISEKTRETYKEIIKLSGQPMGFGYKGLVNTGHNDSDGNINYGISNQLRLSSIPKGEKCIATISFNKDGYSAHCKDFKEYEEWIENRNEARYVETQEHGQKIDGKNMMHCIRLINMAVEIGRGEGIIVNRPDREYLLSIRRGEVDLDTLIVTADKAIEDMDLIFDNSELPESVKPGLINEILINIRKQFYEII
jgi:predicted nucleotidyltransferase